VSHKFKYMKKTVLSLTLLLASGFMVMRASAQVSVGISVHIAPPAIPVYVQPPCPVDGYIWVPGYWAWDEEAGDYYWVPGYWAPPPAVGLLWTPGYWGWSGGLYIWHAGYWGPHVGYYGGINYGCGYGGAGYYGGEWYGGHFRYNTAVTRVNTTVIHNTYVNRTVINNVTVNRVSYNGGPGGVQYRPSAREQEAMHERHVERTSVQVEHQQAAMHDRGSFVHVNHGRPGTPAVARPVAFNRSGNPEMNRPVNRQMQRPQMERPQMARPQTERPMGRPMGRPQMARPQMQRPMERPMGQPQMQRPMPQGRPGGVPPGGGQPQRGGGQPRPGGGEHHHG
jgi:hypothetical protein